MSLDNRLIATRRSLHGVAGARPRGATVRVDRRDLAPLGRRGFATTHVPAFASSAPMWSALRRRWRCTAVSGRAGRGAGRPGDLARPAVLRRAGRGARRPAGSRRGGRRSDRRRLRGRGRRAPALAPARDADPVAGALRHRRHAPTRSTTASRPATPTSPSPTRTSAPGPPRRRTTTGTRRSAARSRSTRSATTRRCWPSSPTARTACSPVVEARAVKARHEATPRSSPPVS